MEVFCVQSIKRKTLPSHHRQWVWEWHGSVLRSYAIAISGGGQTGWRWVIWQARSGGKSGKTLPVCGSYRSLAEVLGGSFLRTKHKAQNAAASPSPVNGYGSGRSASCATMQWQYQGGCQTGWRWVIWQARIGGESWKDSPCLWEL